MTNDNDAHKALADEMIEEILCAVVICDCRSPSHDHAMNEARESLRALKIPFDAVPSGNTIDVPSVTVSVPSPPAGDGLTDEVRALLEKLIEFADADYVPNVLFDRARAILAAPRQPGEMGAGVPTHRHKFSGEQRAFDPADDISDSWQPLAASAQQDERDGGHQ